ncbi:TRAP transporter small permease [Polaribacter sp.]|uniref:TRAP transporter small permease n=1 Tax=Polaribacter sp. TaxID=1920175 RepID=UPI0025CC6F5C|nr:TRAP transporter small permease [Polaribacter sp.]
MRSKIDSVLEKLLLIILVLMLVSVVWQVFSRFVLQAPSTMTDEISSFSLIWIGLLGSAYAAGRNLHLAIDLISENIVKKRQGFFNGIVFISVAFFAFTVMIIGGFRLVQLSFQFGQTSATLEIPLGFIYMVVPISGILICYYSIDTLLNLRKLNKS